jgi:hypothetical protein
MGFPLKELRPIMERCMGDPYSALSRAGSVPMKTISAPIRMSITGCLMMMTKPLGKGD